MPMKPEAQKVNESRRRLLGGALAAGAVGVGVGALGMKLAARTPRKEPAAKRQQSRGYHETEHIRDYYRSTV